MASKHYPGGSVVVVALMGETQILLIKETTKPAPHYWKLIGETVEPGESLLNALIGAVREEAGWNDKNGIPNIGATYEGGKVTAVTDPRIKRIVQFGEKERVEARCWHWRHFFGVLTTDDMVKKLAGAHLSVDADEEIETQMFPLAMLETLPGLMRKHEELIRSIPKCKMVDVK